jgi:hypothetical protein
LFVEDAAKNFKSGFAGLLNLVAFLCVFFITLQLYCLLKFLLLVKTTSRRQRHFSKKQVVSQVFPAGMIYSIAVVVSLLASASADVYMHNPRGSNDRNCERNVNRNNGNRVFDSQNNAKGGYACPRAVGGPEMQNEMGEAKFYDIDSSTGACDTIPIMSNDIHHNNNAFMHLP